MAIACISVVAIVVDAMLPPAGGHDALPAIMQGDRYTPRLASIVTGVWLLGLLSLLVPWTWRPHSSLDLWPMVVLVVRLFDGALADAECVRGVSMLGSMPAKYLG